MFGRGRIKDGVSGSAKILELGPTAKGARQTEKRDVDYRARASAAAARAGDAASAAEALGFTLRDEQK
jgi:hypothetical protein